MRITVLRERNASGENMRREADLEGGATATSVKTGWRSFLMRTSSPVSQLFSAMPKASGALGIVVILR